MIPSIPAYQGHVDTNAQCRPAMTVDCQPEGYSLAVNTFAGMAESLKQSKANEHFEL